MVGMGPAEVRVPLISALIREVDVRGSFRYANWYSFIDQLILDK